MNASTPLTRLRRARSARFSSTVPRALMIFSGACAVLLLGALLAGATTLFNVVVSVLFMVLWLAFAAAILISPSALDEMWQRIRRLPLAAELLIWLLFLPVVAGLWIWERRWNRATRVVLVASIAAVNVFMFLGL